MLKKPFFYLAGLLLLASSCQEKISDEVTHKYAEEESAKVKEGRWTEKALGPDSERMVSFTIGDKAYSGLQGYGFPWTITKTMYSYDQKKDTWTQIAAFPGVERSEHVGVAVDGKGYVGGGFAYDASNEYAQVPYNDFYQYDPATNSWSQKADLPGSGGSYVAFAIGEKLYVSQEGKLWAYTEATNEWTPKANVPFSSGTGFTIGNKGYVLSGTTLRQYDVASDTWITKASAPFHGPIAPTDTKAYVFDNWGNTYEYNPVKNFWIKKADVPVMKFTEGYSLDISYAFGINNKVYVGLTYRGDAEHFFELDPKK